MPTSGGKQTVAVPSVHSFVVGVVVVETGSHLIVGIGLLLPVFVVVLVN